MPITVTLREASHESGLSVRMLYKLIARGELDTRTVGRRRLVVMQSLTKLLGVPAAKDGTRKQRTGK